MDESRALDVTAILRMCRVDELSCLKFGNGNEFTALGFFVLRLINAYVLR